MLSLYSFCSRLRVFVVCCTRFSPPPQMYDISFSCSCVLCRVCCVRVLVVFQSCVVVLRYGTFYLCLYCLYSVFNILAFIQHTINVVLLWYMADFLLVNIYTLVKRLRVRELRVGLVEQRRIQHFLTHKYTLLG